MSASSKRPERKTTHESKCSKDKSTAHTNPAAHGPNLVVRMRKRCHFGRPATDFGP